MSTAIANSASTHCGHVSSFSAKPNWLHVVTHLDPKYGGLSSAVPALGAAVANTAEYSVSLTGFCRDDERVLPSVPANVRVRFAPLDRLRLRKHSPELQHFEEQVSESEGIHIHGLWELSTALSCRIARPARKPVIISAHGMLQSWALANKRWKKIIYSALIERRNLKQAACLHALTRAELKDYRDFGLKNPVAVIPNGVEIPKRTSPELFFDSFPELRGKRLVLFLGRLHPKKGVHALCEAWRRVSSKWPDAHLVLAGPDENNTRAQLEAILQNSRLGQNSRAGRATFTGMLSGPLKWSAFSAASVFTLPSYSEGLSMSILESLGMGVPVVITKECNLPEIVEHSCGYITAPGAAEIAHTLDTVLATPADRLGAMSENGRRLVSRQYSWPAIGEKMAAVYRWAAGGPLPDQVEIHG